MEIWIRRLGILLPLLEGIFVLYTLYSLKFEVDGLLLLMCMANAAPFIVFMVMLWRTQDKWLTLFYSGANIFISIVSHVMITSRFIWSEPNTEAIIFVFLPMCLVLGLIVVLFFAQLIKQTFLKA